MTDFKLMKESENSTTTLTIKGVKDEDKDLNLLEIAAKYEVYVVTKTKQDKGTFTMKEKYSGEPGVSAIESFINGK